MQVRIGGCWKRQTKAPQCMRPRSPRSYFKESVESFNSTSTPIKSVDCWIPRELPVQGNWTLTREPHSEYFVKDRSLTSVFRKEFAYCLRFDQHEKVVPVPFIGMQGPVSTNASSLATEIGVFSEFSKLSVQEIMNRKFDKFTRWSKYRKDVRAAWNLQKVKDDQKWLKFCFQGQEGSIQEICLNVVETKKKYFSPHPINNVHSTWINNSVWFADTNFTYPWRTVTIVKITSLRTCGTMHCTAELFRSY